MWNQWKVWNAIKTIKKVLTFLYVSYQIKSSRKKTFLIPEGVSICRNESKKGPLSATE